jgi:formate/nitrite transporter FocA (FNT family)
MIFEHAVVNMFLFPFAISMGADFTLTDFFLWNEIPTILGNFVGGFFLVGLPIYLTHYNKDDDDLDDDLDDEVSAPHSL